MRLSLVIFLALVGCAPIPVAPHYSAQPASADEITLTFTVARTLAWDYAYDPIVYFEVWSATNFPCPVWHLYGVTTSHQINFLPTNSIELFKCRAVQNGLASVFTDGSES